MSDTYRKNVGIVVCKKGKVLLCARADQKDFQWQFPQGGLEKEEDFIEAGKRELFEETGIENVKLITTISQPIRYDFPKELKYLPFRGQDQYWVLFEFLGDDGEIRFDINPDCIEFKAFRWDIIDVAPNEIVYFKRDVYKKVVEVFKPFVEKINEQ